MDDDRLERERAFHDARFSGALSRDAQQKFYAAIAHGRAAYEARLASLSVGADVLEIGCAGGEEAVKLLPLARTVTGIDVSPVAAARARARGVDAVVGDAEATGLPGAGFDLVCGAGIVHHLDVARFADEMNRVLRPGGRAVFWEPLGHNLAFNAYRRMTPAARTVDEHPLLGRDLDRLAAGTGGRAEIAYHGLATLAVPLWGGRPGAGALARAARALDRRLLAVPGLRRQAWYALIELGPA